VKEITVSNWDDLYFLEGKRIAAEAGPDTVLQLDGKRVELALTAEHKRELADVLATYFKAGQLAQPAQRAGATGTRSQMGASRVYNKGMREWAEATAVPGTASPTTRRSCAGITARGWSRRVVPSSSDPVSWRGIG
jgi:hypothetical protein